MKVKITPRRVPFIGKFEVPPDKSITHRAYILASIAENPSIIENPLRARDCDSTMYCLSRCGVEFNIDGNRVSVRGNLREPDDILDAGNSGTTARLLCGLLSSYPFFSVITGDESLRKRPMARVIKPLRMMQAEIMGRMEDKFLPVAIKGRKELVGIEYRMDVASAQVKSAILLAGLRASGKTVVIEPTKSRDHTENMLKALGANIEIKENMISIESSKISGFSLRVPGDPSSASFLITIAILIPGSHITIKDVLLNPTRIGFLKKLKEIGCNINWEVTEYRLNEPVGLIEASYSEEIRAFKVDREEIPSMIDEIPILSLIATRAHGVTEIRGAEELRVKESDRLKSIREELGKIGAKIEELPDGLIIEGPVEIEGGNTHSHRDHRIAMTLAVSGLISKRGVEIEEAEWVDISFPGFFQVIS